MSGSAVANRVAALSVRNLSKSFAGTLALAGLDLSVAAGEVHAVLGENGSGKSTLIKTLAGYHRPDDGAEIEVGGAALQYGSPESAYALGARFVHQDLGLVDQSSVVDNLSFSSGFPTRLGSINTKAALNAARQDLATVGLDVDPSLAVSELTPAMKTGVAVARALRSDPTTEVKLLVLDEPTATLPDNEVHRLLDIVGRVAASGIGVIYVTHRLDEVFTVADTVTVLRDGRLVATLPTREIDRAALIDLLLGAELDEVRTEAEALTGSADGSETGPEVLCVRGLESEYLHDVDLSVRSGQVVGIAGITGSGRESLLATIFGGTRRDAGTVVVAGKAVRANRPDVACELGIAYLPPDRKIGGGFMQLQASENIMVSMLSAFTRVWTIRRHDESREVGSWMDKLSVSPPNSGRKLLATFSGGNQQKILFSKWLRRKPVVFLLDEPTQGVDVGAKALLHHELLSAVRQGMAVVISSTDVDELAALCNVVVVLRRGRIVTRLLDSDISVAAISRAAIGSTAEVAQ